MGRTEEGGVCTQKLNSTLLVFAILIVAGTACVMMSDSSYAEDETPAGTGTSSVVLEDYSIGGGKKTTATLSFYDSTAYSNVSWTAKLLNSKGTSQSGALSKTSGYTTSDIITVTAPTTEGDYTLEVTFTQKIGTDKITYVSKAILHVGTTIKLSVTVTNNGHCNVDNATLYFYVDGKKIDDSKQENVSIAVGKEKTITYDFFDKDLASGKHTYYLSAGESATTLSGIDAEQTFYYKQSTMDFLNWFLGIAIVLLIVVGIWIYRKPVKNYGKPKARR